MLASLMLSTSNSLSWELASLGATKMRVALELSVLTALGLDRLDMTTIHRFIDTREQDLSYRCQLINWLADTPTLVLLSKLIMHNVIIYDHAKFTVHNYVTRQWLTLYLY